MNITVKIMAACFVGLVVGAGTVYFLAGSAESAKSADSKVEKKISYWVAPMDPDYRRDKPGQSPMGMDLIPVYEGGAGDSALDAGPGTIRISPDVVNNLGVTTAAVERRVLRSRIDAVGYVQYDEDKLIHIHPRVAGWVERLHIKAEGNPVVAGQPLYELYSPELVNAQEELLLALGRNNKRLLQAARDRLRALHLSPGFIDRLVKERRVRQRITFFAAQDGVVDKLKIREGFYVQPGSTLMSIGSLDEVWVEAQIFERQAGLVEAGQPVQMTLDYLPGKAWRGLVDYVYPALDESTRTARVRLRFNNSDRVLKPNMFAQVSIDTGDGKAVLTVPRQALIRTGRQQRVVLALGEGRFKSLAVTVGRSAGDYIEILQGLAQDERVVTSAQFLLDSESSKSSDFKRMNHATMDNNAESMAPAIDREAVDHAAMGHSAMDHGAMNMNDSDEMSAGHGVTDMKPNASAMSADGSDSTSIGHGVSDALSTDRQGMSHEGMSHD